MSDKPRKSEDAPEKPSVTLPGKVEKIIPGPLPAISTQIQHVSVVPLLVALAHRPVSFPEPSAQSVPFIIRVAEPIGLLALRTFRRLLVRERVAQKQAAVALTLLN